MLEWLARLALELVGQGGIGHSFDTLADGEKCRYSAIAKDLKCVIRLLLQRVEPYFGLVT